MKKRIGILFTTLLFCGCSTPPSNPVPHPSKYTVQIIELEVAEHPTRYALSFNNEKIPGAFSMVPLNNAAGETEALLQDPENRVAEYPIIQTGLHTPCSLDETKPVSLTENFIIKNGKVKPIKKSYPLGTSIDLQLIEADPDNITYHIDLKIKRLKGYRPLTVADQTVQMPVFSEKQLDTEIQQPLNEWFSLGTLDKFNDRDNQRRSIQYAVRILPPLHNTSKDDVL